MSKTESAKPDTSVSFRTSIGGQALIEGILMRGPTRQAIVCRTQDGMVEKVEELHWVREKHPILGWPLIRGVIVFLDSMVKGMKALTYSADLLPEDEQEEPGKIDLWIEKHFGEEKAKDIIIGTAVARSSRSRRSRAQSPAGATARSCRCSATMSSAALRPRSTSCHRRSAAAKKCSRSSSRRSRTSCARP